MRAVLQEQPRVRFKKKLLCNFIGRLCEIIFIHLFSQYCLLVWLMKMTQQMGNTPSLERYAFFFYLLYFVRH